MSDLVAFLHLFQDSLAERLDDLDVDCEAGVVHGWKPTVALVALEPVSGLDRAGVEARLALSDDDLAILERVKGCEANPAEFPGVVRYRAGEPRFSTGHADWLLDYLRTGRM